MKKHFIRNRKVRYGGIAVILTVLVVTVTVLFNAVFSTLAKRYSWYANMLGEESYDVTEDCYALLGNLFSSLSAKGHAPKAEIIFCTVVEELAKEPMQLNLYRAACSIAERFPAQITVTCHDIWTNPNTVRDYATTFNPETGENEAALIKSTSVIIVSGDYHRVYNLEEFYVFEDGKTENVWAYNGEKKLAAGILRAVDPDEHLVCFTSNHGETFSDLEILYLLDDAGYTMRKIDLYKDEIPADCDLLISYNPNTDLVKDAVSDTSEIDVLDRFLSVEGNSFWVFLKNGTPELPNFESFLEGWGVDFKYHTAAERSYRYMVQDSSQSLTSDGYTIYGEAVTTGRSGALLQGLDRKVVFKNATAMSAAQGFVNNGDGSFTKGDRTMYSLYEGGANAVSWANGAPVDRADGAILMSLTEQTSAKGSSYVGVIASVDFSAEDFLQSAVYGNTDVLLRSLHNVGKEYTPEGLTIKPFSSQDISTVTTRQMLLWTVGLSLAPALITVGVAAFVLIRRRRA